MNFIDAVQALQSGSCEGILHPQWTQKHEPQYLVLSCNKNELEWLSDCPFMGISISQMLADDWQMVAPQTETVETEPMWGIAKKATGELTGDLFPTEESAADNIRPNYTPVKLSGIYTRPVPVKVKRRERVFGFEGHFSGESTHKFDHRYNIYAEWEETP